MASTHDLPSDTEIVKLDWRHGSTRTQLVSKLESIFVEVDSTHSAVVQLSSSTNQIGQQETATNEKIRQFVHRVNRTERSLDTVLGTRYLPQLLTVVMYLLKLAGRSKPVLKRMFGYELRSANFRTIVAERIWYDIALTVKEHPYRLGIIPDTHGQFVIPSGWQLEVTLCHNIFKFADSVNENPPLGCVNRKFFDHETINIPPLVVSISLTRKIEGCNPVRAVFVTEHRNVKGNLDVTNKQNPNSRIADYLFVMTGGFADLPTREFLHLLSKLPVLKDVPFFFLSDHDPHAFEIYANMKYGSSGTAFASSAMICPQLQWKGPTKAQLEAVSMRSIDNIVAEKEERFGGMTDEARETARQTAATDIQQSLKGIHCSRNAFFDRGDDLRVEHFHKSRLFENETVLNAELEKMGRIGGKFSLAHLQLYNRNGIEEVCVEIVAKHYAEVPVFAQLQETVDVVRRAFNQHPGSQGGPSNQARQEAERPAPNYERDYVRGLQRRFGSRVLDTLPGM